VKKKVLLFSGGGGMVSTIGDYGKFGQMLLNGGELNGVRILEESTVTMITSDQYPKTASTEKFASYGLGGYVDLETGRYGWSGAASTDFVLDVKNDMVILTFTQYTPFMGTPFVKEFKELVEKALLE
jgi:CubicO group peptidase (beta-lactamase class C family)